MASKRMFAKTIVGSDAFLSLPPKAQCLYFQLSMYADDDGVVNNTKSILAMANTTKKEFNELINSKFIIELDGLTIIKHWRINNYIPKDRYTPSKYQETLSKLKIDENNAYTTNENVDINVYSNVDKNVYNLDTQYRIDKNRIDKNNNINNDPYILFKNLNIDRNINNYEYIELANLIKAYGKERINETIIQISNQYKSFTTKDIANKFIKEEQ